MKTLSLFKQKPKVVKYRPAPKTRLIGSLDLDRKGELEKFKKWLEFASKEKSDLPTEDEIKKLNKDIEKQPASGFSIASLLSALPFALPGLGALGLGALTAGALTFGNPQRYATRLIIKSLVKGGLKLGQKLLPKNQKVPKAKTSLPPRPGTRGRPRVTTTGGGRAGRPDFRNPLRQRPGVTGTGGGRFGRPDIRNPLRQRPNITQGIGGTRRFSISRLLRTLPKRTLQRLTGSLVRKFFTGVGGLFRRIPIIGGLIDFAVRLWIFKEPLGEAAFRSIGSIIGGALGGVLGSALPGFGNFVGALAGGSLGDWLGGILYNTFFKPKKGSAQAQQAEEFEEDEDLAAFGGGGPVSAVGELKDYKGRPIKLSGPASAAFRRMAKAAADDGIDIGPGISISYRTPSENERVGGVSNSAHLYGEAFDINWNSEAGKWIRANAQKYGFKYNPYSPQSTHFDWMGARSEEITRVGSIAQTENSPSLARPTIPFAEGMANPLEFLDLLGSVLTPPPPMQEVSAVKTDTNIARFTPEAEAANSESIVVVTQAAAPQLPQQAGGAQIIPFPVGGSSSGQSTTVVVSSLNSLEDLLLTKLDNA